MNKISIVWHTRSVRGAKMPPDPSAAQQDLRSADRLQVDSHGERISNGDRMNTCIAFLRGINVGGNSSLPMKELVAILEAAGARRIKTYIQSGNAVFQGEEKTLSQLPKKVAAEIKKRYGFEPRILVLDVEALRRAIAENPFPEAEADPGSLHLGFLASRPRSPDLDKLSSLKKESERFHLGDGVFYLHAPEGVGRSRLAASAEKLLGVPMTDRNWKTVCKVMGMAGDK